MSTSERSREIRMPWTKTIALGAAAAVAFGGVGCASNVNAEPGKPSSSTSATGGNVLPSASSSPTPEQKPAPPALTREQRVKQLEIKSGLTAEQFAEAFMDRLAIWEMSGATEKLWEDTYKTPGRGRDANQAEAQRVAKAEIDVLGEGLLVKDWKSNIAGVPKYLQLLSYIETSYVRHWQNINQWAVNHGRDGYPDFETGFKVSAFENLPRADATPGRSVQIVATEVNNASKVFADTHNAAALSDQPFCLRVGTVIDGDRERVNLIEPCSKK